MKTISLPSGAEAEILEPDDLSFGDREDVFASLAGVDVNNLGGREMNLLCNALITLAVKSWTCIDPHTGEVLPLPSVDPTSVRRLRLKDGSALDAIMRKEIMMELIADFDVSPVDGSPTQP